MALKPSEYGHGLEEDKLNNHYRNLLANNKKDIGGSGKDIQDILHNKPTSGTNPTGPMKGDLMTWTQMLEAMDVISANTDNPDPEPEIEECPIGGNCDTPGQVNEDEILAKLNQIFTPILVMQGFEGDLVDKIQESVEDESLLLERNIINFDDATRMAQLISACALLIAQQKNTDKWQMYSKAATIRNKMKLDIQKDEYEQAKALAQKFLVKVSTTNNSSYARDAATSLLPETQH